MAIVVKKHRALILLFLGIFFMSGALATKPYSVHELRSLQTEDETKIHELRQQEITQLKIALGRRLPSNRQAELYLRLAELYLESYRAAFLLEGRVHEKKLQDGISDPFIKRNQSKPYLALGIKACQEILRLRIPFDRMDQVYYFLGINYRELDRRTESIKFFETLVNRYPSSHFVTDAYRELGDDAFATNRFRQAVDYYENAAKKGKDLGDRYARVLHKLAWSYYKTRQFNRAVETLKVGIQKASEGGEKLLSLKEEALRDMAIFMTEGGRVEEAVIFFEKVADKEFYPKTLEKLARQFERNVEPLKATQVYEFFLKTKPNEEAAFRARVKLVDLDLRRGKFFEALSRLDGAPLLADGSEETILAYQNLKAMIRRTATEHHEKFRQKGSKEDVSVAESFYSFYLDRFLTRKEFKKEVPEIQMYFAEVKKELGKPKEATTLYQKVLDSSDSRYSKEAAVLKLASLSDVLKKAAQLIPPTGVRAHTEPSLVEKEFIQTTDELEDRLKDIPEGREAALKIAQILAGYSSTQKDAVRRIRAILEKWPKSVQALTAARLWIQIHSDQLAVLPPGEVTESDVAEKLSDAMKEIRQNQSLLAYDQSHGGGKLAQLLQDQDTRFRVGLIALFEKKRDYASAAKGYEEFAVQAQKVELAEKSYASSVVAYLKIPDTAATLRVASAWLKRFPASPVALSSLRSAATNMLIQGQYLEAAQIFETLGKGGHDPDSLETASRIQEGVGNIQIAEELLNHYLRVYPKSSKIQEILLRLSKLYEQTGLEGEAAKNYQKCMSMGAGGSFEPECGARLADLYFKSKDKDKAKEVFKKVITKNSKKRFPFVAYARFRLATLEEENAHLPPLELPDSKLKKALSARVSLMTSLSKAYLSVLDAGGPWVVAALDRLATWVMRFADEVDRITPALGSSADSAKQFKNSLKRISDPLRVKAIQTWKDAYQNALESEVLSPVLPELGDRFAELGWKATASFSGRAQGFQGRFRLAGIASDGGKEGAETALAKVRSKLLQNPQEVSSWVDYGNLLWGDGKPLLAKIAYERASHLTPKNTSALNNRGVILLDGGGTDDWYLAAQAMVFFQEALKQDEFFVPAKINRGLLLNYYRLFRKSKVIWEQVSLKVNDVDILDSMGVALQGIGNFAAAKEAFQKAGALGASSSRFVQLYHEAALKSLDGREGVRECLSKLEDLNSKELVGFEVTAVDRLKRTCETWKAAN